MKNNSVYEPKNTQEWFLTYLFNDPEFVNDKERIVSNIRSLVGPEAASVMFLLTRPNNTLSDQLKQKSKSRIATLLSVLQPNKPELQFDPNSPAAMIIKDIQEVASKFGVSIVTIEQGLRYSNQMPLLAFHGVPIATVEENYVVIRIGPTMRLEDIQSIYPEIMKLQSKLNGYSQRNRSKVHPELIYAIYKARKLKNMKFKDIYRLYESGRLPGYEGDTSIIGEENLARMYRRFKPDI